MELNDLKENPAVIRALKSDLFVTVCQKELVIGNFAMTVFHSLLNIHRQPMSSLQG